MNFEQTQQYIMAKPEVVEHYPSDSQVRVYKVRHKMFATLTLGKNSEYYWLNLKCDPQESLMLRDKFPSIVPGYHMNKKHWNTIILDETIPQGEIQRLIDNSFLLVVGSMTDDDRLAIEAQLSA